jgi:hypothetical protein
VVTHLTGTPYDVSPMYIGTVHALCQRLLTDRRFSQGGRRPVTPLLYDALDQYFYVSAPRYWETATAMVGLSPNATETINTYFSGRASAWQPILQNASKRLPRSCATTGCCTRSSSAMGGWGVSPTRSSR